MENVNCLKHVFFGKHKKIPRPYGRGEKKTFRRGRSFQFAVTCSYEREASFFASFAFLFAALFLCRTPLLAAESIAETVSG